MADTNLTPPDAPQAAQVTAEAQPAQPAAATSTASLVIDQEGDRVIAAAAGLEPGARCTIELQYPDGHIEPQSFGAAGDGTVTAYFRRYEERGDFVARLRSADHTEVAGADFTGS